MVKLQSSALTKFKYKKFYKSLYGIALFGYIDMSNSKWFKKFELNGYF